MGNLKEVALVFFKLGLTAFGGPAAHIAMMEEEVVARRKWMSREHFLDLMGATNLIPGPNSTEMAIHCGFHRAGWPGLIAAGVCFICPAVVLTGFFADIYVRFGTLPAIEPFFYGIRPAVLAVIISAVIKFGQKAVKSLSLGVIGVLVAAASLAGISEIAAILAGGILGAVWLNVSTRRENSSRISAIVPLPLYKGLWAAVLPVASASAGLAVSAGGIFLIFLKIGFVLFGSGYVLIAYLQGELVQKLGWLTESQLLDAVAVGQFTPGPVLSTATFIGYQLNGVAGAVAATLGIFLPSFLLVAILNPLVPRLRRSVWASRFLDAVNVSAVGIMAAVVVDLIGFSLQDGRTAVIAGLSLLAVLVFKKANAGWLILGGALAGYLLKIFW